MNDFLVQFYYVQGKQVHTSSREALVYVHLLCKEMSLYLQKNNNIGNLS
jgi:hypothetical protein